MNGVVQNLLFHQNCVSNEKQIIDTFQHKMSTNWNLNYLFFVKYNTTRHTEARQEERKEENRREKKRTEQNRREERREGTAKEGRGEDRRRGRGEEKRGEQRRGDEGEERKGEERRGEERRGEIINITKGTTSEDKYSAIVNGSLTTDLDLRSSDVISHNVCCVPVNVTSVFHSP